jgi:hypothetical protein
MVGGGSGEQKASHFLGAGVSDELVTERLDGSVGLAAVVRHGVGICHCSTLRNICAIRVRVARRANPREIAWSRILR